MIYFNEFDPHAAAWLRNLMEAGLIPKGHVDERSIKDVRAKDLVGYRQCHFFAGISGWTLALRLAGFPDDREVWTGSCPCQPYSSAGKRAGAADERDLWPDFFRLIRARKPELVFGEQVASSDVVGEVGGGDGGRTGESAVWLDRIFSDLESALYSCAAFDLPAASVNAPHIRQRLYWLADAGHGRRSRSGHGRTGGLEAEERSQQGVEPLPGGMDGGMANSDGRQSSDGGIQRSGEQRLQPESSGPCRMVNPDRREDDTAVAGQQLSGEGRDPSVRDRGAIRGVGELSAGRLGHTEIGGQPIGGNEALSRDGGHAIDSSGPGFGHWSESILIPCRDGKYRRAQSGIFPLANGVSGRVAVERPDEEGFTANKGEAEKEVRWVNRAGALKGSGNAIVPQLAAEFIKAYLRTEQQ